MNQFAFYTNDRINRHNVRVANATRAINFEMLRDNENNIDSNFDFLQIEISIKRVLKNIIDATNNEFANFFFENYEKIESICNNYRDY